MDLKLSHEEAKTLKEYLNETINGTMNLNHSVNNESISKDLRNLRAVYYQLLINTGTDTHFD